MCYTPQMSFAFFVIGLAASAYIVMYNRFLRSTKVHYLLLFYSLMELLQTVQYYYVNECTNRVNSLLTEAAYVLVVVQPLMWNFFFYLNSNACEKNIFKTAMALSCAWIVFNVAARVAHTPKNAQTKDASIFASERVCTKRGIRKLSHLYWEWTSANFHDFNATFLTYLMLWFIPGLISSKHRMSMGVTIAGALLGAAMAYASGEPFTFSSAWCYISVPMTLAVIGNVLLQKQK